MSSTTMYLKISELVFLTVHSSFSADANHSISKLWQPYFSCFILILSLKRTFCFGLHSIYWYETDTLYTYVCLGQNFILGTMLKAQNLLYMRHPWHFPDVCLSANICLHILTQTFLRPRILKYFNSLNCLHSDGICI